MISVRKYIQNDKQIWDEFIKNSKNGTFILKRDYMEYHSDRFQDYSLMFFDDEKLIALLPASIHGNELRSHGGLTYGGIVSNYKMTVQKMLDVFEALKMFLAENNIQKLLYKRIPSIFYRYPSDEDLYALFLNNALLVRRNISTSVLIKNKLKFSELRRRGIKKALKNNLTIKQSVDYDAYINMLNKLLASRHDSKAVHTAQELKFLADKFPNNIKMFCAFTPEDIMIAGIIIYETETTVHTQYIANSDEGCEVGALDLVVDYLINEYSKDKTYFDMGTSMEDGGGIYVNNGLISQKEGFGGRAIVYDFYELNIDIV